MVNHAASSDAMFKCLADNVLRQSIGSCGMLAVRMYIPRRLSEQLKPCISILGIHRLNTFHQSLRGDEDPQL